MKVKPELRKLIESKAAAYKLDPDLVEAHILTESSGKPDATRFEHHFYEHYVLPLGLHDQNEARGRATSFGLLQIMGQVARELGYQGAWSGLMEPSTNLEYGCKKLAKCYKKYAPDLDAGIAAYNSGTPRKKGEEFINQIYVDRVKGFLKMIKADK
ncbi:MAG: transglycosylase SLT domain-containing protein [Candidatus Omnitrophota bacterium]|jgi:soluble lytic murein transglycosylase-like protein